jgi:hypothetical protein
MEEKLEKGSKTVMRTGFRRHPIYLLYWYKSTNTDAKGAFLRKKATVQSAEDASAPEMLRDIWNQKAITYFST